MRLLLAEDEKSLSKALVSILKHENYSVDAVYNGADAVDYAESGVYDCIILDVMMPVADGITALKTLRAAGNKAPVILLTAKTQIEDRVTGLDASADDYLTKPFAAKELLARIRAVTRRQPELKNNVLSFGDLKLNRESFELSTAHGSGTVLAVGLAGGMSGETTTSSPSFSTIGTGGTLRITKGTYLIAEGVFTVRVPVTMNALVAVLGKTGASISAASSSDLAFDQDGVYRY